jgi:branched-chain amino acid transport system substrate-binding protein
LKKDFDEEKMPTIPASFHAGNLVDSSYIFLPIASYSAQAIGLAEYIANNHKGDGTPKVAMFLHPSAFGRGPLEDVQKAVAAGLKIEIVEVVEHGKDLDNTAMLQRLKSKGVQYVIGQTIQSPVATMLKDASRLGLVATSFGEKGKITFTGCHYTGGNDLVSLAGPAAENYYWTTSYIVTSEPGVGRMPSWPWPKNTDGTTKRPTPTIMPMALWWPRWLPKCILRAKAKGLKITKENLYAEMLAMNGMNAFYPVTTVGAGNLLRNRQGRCRHPAALRGQRWCLHSVGAPFIPEYTSKIK